MTNVEKLNRFRPAIEAVLDCMDEEELEALPYIGYLAFIDMLKAVGITFEDDGNEQDFLRELSRIIETYDN